MNIVLIIFKSLFSIVKSFLFYIGIPLLFVFIVLFALFIFWTIKWSKSGELPKYEDKIPNIKSVSLFYKLFYQFPKMFAYDSLHRNPFEFTEYGIIQVVGKQGSGKTITAIYLINKWKERYPNLQVYDNYCLNDDLVNGRLDTRDDLMSHDNGIYGVVNFLDEIQNWFSSSDSRSIPAPVLSEVCQQRKQRKITLGTTQVFGKLAKPLREQTLKVYVPRTLFGCLTFVRCYDADTYNMDTNKFKKGTGEFFFFVHTKELRESYDTYKKIDIYKSSNFAPALSDNSDLSE